MQMSGTEQNIRDAILRLCERAMGAELTLDELYEVWTDEIGSMRGFTLVLTDVEDAVEHVSGLLNGQVDWRAWEEEEARRVLALDIEALREANTSVETESRRESLLREAGIRRAWKV